MHEYFKDDILHLITHNAQKNTETNVQFIKTILFLHCVGHEMYAGLHSCKYIVLITHEHIFFPSGTIKAHSIKSNSIVT